MKRISLFQWLPVLLLWVSPFITYAQPADFVKVENAEKQNLIGQITKASNAVQTLECNFSEVKQLSFLTTPHRSNGKMYFKQPNSLKWEYTAPEKQYFIFYQNKITYGNEQNSSTYNTNSNKAFKALSELIVGFISGKALQENPNFEMTYYQNNSQVLVKLSPISKEMKKMVSEVELFLNKKSWLADKIVIYEISGDITRFSFSAVQTNNPIANEFFSIK